MARSIKQIQQELDKIKETVANSARELETLYDQYIACLSESAHKQLILAGYQLCTQIYPQAFMAMSLSQRQKLQQNLRQLGQKMQLALKEKPTEEDFIPEKAELNLIAEMLKKLPLESSNSNSQETEELDNFMEDDNEFVPEENEAEMVNMLEEEENEQIEEEIAEFNLASLQNLANQNFDTSKMDKIDLSNPHHLILWCKKIDSNIKQILNDTSREANKNLQEFDVIPKRLPHKVIDVALQAGENNSGGKTRKIPNIINLVIETEKKPKNKPSIAAQISLLRLHLSEIEFIDTKLSSQKNQIRIAVKKVKNLESLYRQREQEYTIAEADSAWRSSWYED